MTVGRTSTIRTMNTLFSSVMHPVTPGIYVESGCEVAALLQEMCKVRQNSEGPSGKLTYLIMENK